MKANIKINLTAEKKKGKKKRIVFHSTKTFHFNRGVLDCLCLLQDKGIKNSEERDPIKTLH